MLLESSIMRLDNIYSTVITQDDSNMFKVQATERSSTLASCGPIRKDYTKLKRGKHSSLFVSCVNDEEKKFYNTDTWTYQGHVAA